MSILSFPSSSPRRPVRTSSFAALSDLWTSAVQAWRIRQADRAMHLLSDELLHDIGVARSEIEDVTRHGRCTRSKG